MKRPRQRRARGNRPVTGGGGSAPVASQVAAPARSSGLGDLLFRDWSTQYEGSAIRVERRGLRLRLVIDESVRDSRWLFPGRDKELPVLSAHLDCSRAEVVIVEAYLRGLRMRIKARGRQIGGDADPNEIR